MIAGIFDKWFKKKPKQPEEEYYEYSEADFPEEMGLEQAEYMPGFDRPQFLDVPSNLDMDSNIYYGFDGLEYRLKLHNKSTDMIGDIAVVLKANKKSVIDVVDSKQVVEMLDPGKTTTIKLKLQPKFIPGKSGLYGKVEYFDFKSKERSAIRLPQAFVDFNFSNLDNKRIDDDQWRQICSGMNNYEIETDTIDTPPDKVFDIFKNVMNNFGFFMLPPIENINLYRGIAKFYGFDDENNKFTAEVQVIGDSAHSKILFRIWSNDPQNAMGIAFKAIDIIDGTIKIKNFILKK
jgi:hypothetical protein